MKRTRKFLRNQTFRRQRKSQKANERFKAYTTIQNRDVRRRQPKKRRTRTSNSPVFLTNTKERIELPEVFSISEDPEAVLKLVYYTKKLVEQKQRLRSFDFDFSKVTQVDDGAATILLSVCNDISSLKYNVRINLPKSDTTRKFMIKSGFIKYFDVKVKDPTNPNVTIKKGKSKILQSESAKIIHKAMQTVFGQDSRNTRLQGLMIELMTNSVNHAYISQKSKSKRHKTWLISSNHYTDEKKVEFCFVDNGDGVINTISRRFKDLLMTNDQILMNAFEGQFRSRTKLKNRGKGLVVVRDSHNKLTIKGLKVITNDVLLDFTTKTATKLKTPFRGTFYSWILDQSCIQP